MNIKDLRDWLKELPTEFDDFDLVFRKIVPLDKDNWSAYDKTIASCGVDSGNNEVYFCDEDSHNNINNE